MNGFETQLAIGAVNEQYIKQYLEGRGHTVTDLTNNSAYWKKDIDFMIANKTGDTAYLEVKLDKNLHKSGNFFIEDGWDRVTGYYNGWLHYCEADYICFYDSVSKEGYILDFPKLKENVKKLGSRKIWENKLDKCVGFAYLLPIGKAKKEDLVVYEWRD